MSDPYAQSTATLDFPDSPSRGHARDYLIRHKYPKMADLQHWSPQALLDGERYGAGEEAIRTIHALRAARQDDVARKGARNSERSAENSSGQLTLGRIALPIAMIAAAAAVVKIFM